MKSHRQPFFWLILNVVVLLLIALPLPVVAQTASQLVVAYTNAFPDPEGGGLTLQFYFALLDQNGKPIVNPQIRQARFVLDPQDGGEYDARVQKASGPIELVLVLDRSGSMGRLIPEMRKAAIDLVNKAGQDARFTVISFSDDIRIDQESTNDRNRVINAIGTIQAKPNGPTCLYDATMKGLETLGLLGVKGRRAVIVFTDGVDEISANGPPCSKSTIGDVTKLATNPLLRIPLYTIGFQRPGGRPVAQAELRTMASATGGTVAIGSDIASIFKEIDDALNAQQIAEAVVKPCRGQKTAQLRIVMNDGTQPTPGIANFTSPEEYCFKTPTPTQTFTPLPPVRFNVNAPRLDPATREFILEVTGIVSENQVKEYLIELISSGGLGLGQFVIPAPLKSPLRVPIPEIPGQKLVIRLSAFSPDGQVLFRAESQAEYIPTPTPTPTVTPTPPPVGATLEQIAYTDEAIKDTIMLNLRLLSPEQIGHLKVTLVGSGNVTRLTVEPIIPAPQIPIKLEGVPAGDYTVNVFAIGKDGQQLSLSSLEFEHTRQPTPTPTLSPTPTPIVPVARLGSSVRVDRETQTLVLSVETENQDLIKRYVVEVINAETNERLDQRFFSPPPFDQVRIPLRDLPRGKYRVTLRGLDEVDKPITEISAIEFEYNPPVPTPTLTPTLEPTPVPCDFICGLGQAINDPNRQPIVLGIAGTLLLGLGMIFFVLVRPRRRSTGTSFLSEMTGAVPIPKLEAQPKPKATTSERSSASAADSDRTSAIPAMMMPQVTLMVESTRHMPALGQAIVVTHSPFTLGRKGRDYNFEGDDNVSRQHAEILYENGTFYILDNNSTHGTYLDNQKVPPGVRVPLYHNAAIRLGTTTILRFIGAGSGGYMDPDKTSPEMPSSRR